MLGVSLLLTSSWAARGQNIYPEKLAGCQLRQFCLDCGDPKAQYPAELTAYFREKLPAAALRQATGGALVQVLVDSAPGLGRKGGVGRSYADAPEIDGIVRLLPPEKISKTMKVGEFTRARIVGVEGHDLVALPV